MRAYEADWSLLGSASRPSEARWTEAPVLDALDVADLESERAHGYALGNAERAENYLAVYGGLADGARARRTKELFRLRVARGGVVVMRAAAESPGDVSLSFDGQPATARVSAGPWLEVGFDVPEALFAAGEAERSVTLELTATNELSTLHYWSLVQTSRAPTAERTLRGERDESR